MSLSKFVKIANISNLSDARYCSGMMVDILGFEISDNTSEHYVDPDTFQELTQWVAGVSFAGECHNTSAEDALRLISNYQIQYLELNQLDVLMDLSNQTDRLLIFNLKIDKKSRFSEVGSILKQAANYAEIVIIDCEANMDSTSIEELIPSLDIESRLLRAFDLNTKSIAQIAPFWDGIELKGSTEKQAGFKDYGIVMDILELIEED